MNCKRATLTRLALFCAAAVMATSAFADAPSESINVSYVAADLATPRGAEKVYQHIQRAARLVCDKPDLRELERYRLYQQCYDRAVDGAVAKVNSTALTALHRSKSHSTTG
jgi:UrcA family protein